MTERQEANERNEPSDEQPSGEQAKEPATDLSARLHSIAIHLLRRARQDDVSFGLSAARLSALSVLVYGGSHRLTELAAAEQVRPPTMTRMVQAMQRDGLVSVRAARSDARAKEIRATAKGRRLLERARQARLAHLEEVLSHTSTVERRQIERALLTLTRALEAGDS